MKAINTVDGIAIVNKVSRKNNSGIGAFCVSKLKEGWSAKEVLELVLESFPQAKTSIKCVYWYASKNGINLRAKSFDALLETEEVVETIEMGPRQPQMGEVITLGEFKPARLEAYPAYED